MEGALRTIFAGAFGLVLSAANQSGGSGAAAAEYLAYLDSRAPSQVELLRADPRGGHIDVLQSLRHRPGAIIWRRDGMAVISIGPDGVHSTELSRRPFVSNRIGGAAPAGVVVRDGWIDKDERSIIVVGARSGRGGEPACSLYASVAGGAWVQRRLPAPVKGEDACDALAEARRVQGPSISSAALLARMPCAATGSVCDAAPGPSGPDLVARLRQARVDTEAMTTVDSEGSAWFLVFRTSQGDTPHLMGEAYAVSRQAGEVRRLGFDADRQLQVSLRGRLALIASEYSGDDPQIVDLDTGAVIFRAKGSAAAWVPAAVP